jgi:hypothetical protein
MGFTPQKTEKTAIFIIITMKNRNLTIGTVYIGKMLAYISLQIGYVFTALMVNVFSAH